VAFLTVAEVASVMRVCKMRVYRLVHSGLPAIRVGRSFLYLELRDVYAVGEEREVCDAFQRDGAWPRRTCRSGVVAFPSRRSTSTCTADEGVIRIPVRMVGQIRRACDAAEAACAQL
jgi:excisionase family DNA binding protein